MKQVVIENPVLNSPYLEPGRHFRFTDEGITDEVVSGRRPSGYFVPIAPPRKSSQLRLDTEWTQDRYEQTKLVNDIRERISRWRQGGYVNVTPTTRRLLEYWTDPTREKKLFFCQIEALETLIYVTEVASKYDPWIETALREANDGANPGLPRIALKMATGSGKTVVMAMLIAWHALNKLENPQDARFSEAFLLVTPGITIRDRLRVLYPQDPESYYRQRDILPSALIERLQRARVLITNFHSFLLREREGSKLGKVILGAGESGAFKETPDEMVRRVCRELSGKRNIVVVNDEAHHCYRSKPDGEDVDLKGDERKAAAQRDEDARVWISGLEAVKRKLGLRTIYDLSATPFFLRGSGYREGTLFPWVASDFSLIDAIESGIVKVPRVPVADDSVKGDLPTYRNLWIRIRDDLPKKRRSKEEGVRGAPALPAPLEAALQSLYANYEKAHAHWEAATKEHGATSTPPVFIVVCNNTSVSKLVFDYIAGWEETAGESTTVKAGALRLFRNDDGRGGWLHRPTTILVDSTQLESGDAMSPEFKKIAAAEIEEFKSEIRRRFPGRDVEELTDEDLLREVMNTVGKPGKLGEHVKCVVSVSMLTEGWDANTVTHILGVRAFGTQLLCEQVVGRALRRMSYATNPEGRFDPEYAEVYGVPFSFIPCSGSSPQSKPPKPTTRVRALEERIACEIRFPRLVGYRYELSGERLSHSFTEDSRLSLSTEHFPTKTENAPIVGESVIHTLDDLKKRRPAEIAFLLAKLTLEKYFRADGEQDAERPAVHSFRGEVKSWLFPQVLEVSRRWLDECVTCKGGTFPQLLLLVENAHDAADRIYTSIVTATEGAKTLLPILHPHDASGTTRFVDFDTARPVYSTRADKCHVSHVVADTGSWEQKVAQTLEDMSEVVHYVKNVQLGFTIPYTVNGESRNYMPDFLCHVDDARGADNLLNLIVEVSGLRDKDKAAKVATARTLWVPAVSNHGALGRWAFVEVTDPWDAETAIRGTLEVMKTAPRARIEIPKDKVAEFCRRHRIRRLALFGSVLRDDFTPQSDVDVLVEFQPGTRLGMAYFVLGDELGEILGYPVDLRTEPELSKYFREEVMAELEDVYVAP
jgi:type III restriction enzyme